jgi:hypothetical protein
LREARYEELLSQRSSEVTEAFGYEARETFSLDGEVLEPRKNDSNERPCIRAFDQGSEPRSFQIPQDVAINLANIGINLIRSIGIEAEAAYGSFWPPSRSADRFWPPCQPSSKPTWRAFALMS